MGYSVTLSFLLFFSFFRWGSKNSHIQNLEGAKFEISLRRDMENVKSTVVHTDLGLKDTAWAGDRHLRAISKKITIIVSLRKMNPVSQYLPPISRPWFGQQI